MNVYFYCDGYRTYGAVAKNKKKAMSLLRKEIREHTPSWRYSPPKEEDVARLELQDGIERAFRIS